MRNNHGQRRRTGAEFRALAWAMRHPLTWGLPLAAGVTVALLGLLPVALAVGSVLALVLVWARAHPGSWLLHGAPRLRSIHHRWTLYLGPRWAQLTTACDLVRADRRTGVPLVPRILRVASPTPTIDRVTVRLPAGQAVRAWQDSTDELRDTLQADGLAITRHRPGVVALTILRGNPFADYVPPVDIPAEVDEVDVTSIALGDTEYGTDWREQLYGQHLLVAGATGSGKGSLIWNPLRALGPLIREGLVQVWMVDPKGGMETARARDLFYRWADHVADSDDDEYDGDDDDGPDRHGAGESAIRLITDFRDQMKRTQRDEAAAGSRKYTMTTTTPWNILIVDEFAMLSALSNRRVTNSLEKLCAEVMTQGRSAGFSLWAYLQEPTKDILSIRDLFTRRVCLRTNTDIHVDMVLGDGARKNGALCDEIPAGDAHAGIGFRVDDHSRQPQRIRAGHVTDDDIDELIRTCTPYTDHSAIDDDGDEDEGGSVVSFPAA